MAVVVHHPVWGAIVREVPEKDVAAWVAAGWVLPTLKSEVSSPAGGVSVRNRRADGKKKKEEQ